MVEKIRDFLEWGGGRLGGDHHFRGWGFGGRGFDNRGCFFLVFPEDGLVAKVDIGLGFLDPAVFLVTVTLGFECASVTA
jgi:hypothetical protein